MDALAAEVQEFVVKIGDIGNDTVLAHIGRHIEELMGETAANPNALALKLRELNRDTLTRVQDTMDGTNCDLKINSIKGGLFKDDLIAIKSKETKIAALKELMKTSVKYMCVNGFANESGDINWKGQNSIKSLIEGLKSDMDKAAGAAAEAARAEAARAEAARAAAAAADDGMGA